MTALFRPEALDGQRQSWLGGIQLIRPLPMRVLTAFTVGVAALTIGFLFFGEYTRKAHLTGVLVPEPGPNDSPATASTGPIPPQPRLQAELYAPASAIGFLRAGRTVQLRYQALPYPQFGHHAGQVLQVSRTPLAPIELAELPLTTAGTGAVHGAASAGEPLYRVTVALDQQAVPVSGEVLPLAAGMQLEADVLLETRRLIEWLFEPVIGLARRV